MMRLKHFLVIFSLYLIVKNVALAENVWKSPPDVHEVKEPFRMAKLNLLWSKAQKRLSEPKLKTLHSEIKFLDKEEVTLKKLKIEGGDKGGLKEAELRKKLRGIMARYNLLENLEAVDSTLKQESYLNEVTDQKILKAVFKDKKLDRLWYKAQASGFSEVELNALKEEFQHHQDKVDEYYQLLNSASAKHSAEQNRLENDVRKFDSFQDLELPAKSAEDHTNLIREKHRELKTGYDHLHKISSTGPDSKEFIEPKVAGLWKLAVRGDFTQEELESLHTELKHYEHRLLKVRHMTGQLDVLQKTGQDDLEKLESTEGKRILQERLIKQQRKVDKFHEDLEQRILQRHMEL